MGCLPISAARSRRFVSETLRLRGDHTALTRACFASSAIIRNATPRNGTCAAALVVSVTPSPSATMCISVSRPTSHRRMFRERSRSASLRTIWSRTFGRAPPCRTRKVAYARSSHPRCSPFTNGWFAGMAISRGSLQIRREWQSGASTGPTARVRTH